jgi:arylsulfatase A-like enzyme
MINHRFLLHVGLIAASSEVPASIQADPSSPPNFIVIFTDDQGYQDLGCFGSPTISTPNLDQMAADGVRFTDFYVAAPLCSPSRGALLTGKYPARLGIAKGVFMPKSKNGLAPQEITIADMLKQKDYTTACIGKWHLGHLKPFLPLQQGFDLFFGIPYSNDMWLAPGLKSAVDIKLTDGMTLEQMKVLCSEHRTPENAGRVPLMRGNEIVEFPAEQDVLTRRYTEEAVRFIAQNKETPFFIYFTPSMPHVPLYASERFRGKSRGGLYGDAVEEIDWAVGEIFQCLEKNGLSENTLVVFTSDNGPWLSRGKDGGHALPLRNGKGSVFEGGLRVPCIMKMPGTIPAGIVCSELATTMDLLPTFGNMADVPLPKNLDGKDIQDLITAKPGAKSPHDVFLYYSLDGKPSAIRQGDWKLVFGIPVIGYSRDADPKQYPENPADFKPELYNLGDDIGETVNVYDQYPELAERMLKRAQREIQEVSQNAQVSQD